MPSLSKDLLSRPDVKLPLTASSAAAFDASSNMSAFPQVLEHLRVPAIP